MLRKIKLILKRFIYPIKNKNYGFLNFTSSLDSNVKVYNKKNLFMYENTNIDSGGIIMNTRARFIMKKNSGAAIGLTVITGNHISIPGMWFKTITNSVKDEYDKNGYFDQDVVVEEDVWIASNVTLLSGVTIGRGAEIGSGTVVRKSTPPYSIVVGNPAKIVGFKFTPEEVIEHERVLYPEEEQLRLEILEKNYNKYFLSQIKEIKQYIK